MGSMMSGSARVWVTWVRVRVRGVRRGERGRQETQCGVDGPVGTPGKHGTGTVEASSPVARGCAHRTCSLPLPACTIHPTWWKTRGDAGGRAGREGGSSPAWVLLLRRQREMWSGRQARAGGGGWGLGCVVMTNGDGRRLQERSQRARRAQNRDHRNVSRDRIGSHSLEYAAIGPPSTAAPHILVGGSLAVTPPKLVA